MLIPPKYFLTPKIAQLLAEIEGARAVVDSVGIAPEIEQNIRRSSTLRSALYSARIEGNDLSLEEVLNNPSRNQKKIEVFNILKAQGFVLDRGQKDLAIKDILTLHRLVLENLYPKSDLGQFRGEAEAIYNAAGIAIYLAPPPRQIKSLLERLIKFVNVGKEAIVVLKACLAHYSFEKIHPFQEGNGRVGRLLLQLILRKYKYHLRGLLNLEEYLDNHRSEYYRSLEESEKDVTEYLEFMLEAINWGAQNAKAAVLEKQQAEASDYLLPRRAEILNIIKDHQLVNFDFLRRRFMSVNERTLRYDIKKLQDAGFIHKRGTTNGVYYESN